MAATTDPQTPQQSDTSLWVVGGFVAILLVVAALVSITQPEVLVESPVSPEHVALETIPQTIENDVIDQLPQEAPQEFQPSGSCTDSDGNNPYTLGFITENHVYTQGQDNTYPDMCAENTLAEGVCQVVNNIWVGSQQVYTCPYGCENGACRTEPLQPTTEILAVPRTGSLTRSGDVGGILRINGQENPQEIKYGEEFTVMWDTQAKYGCSAFGHYIPIAGGGMWTDEMNLMASGTRVLIAKHENFGYVPELQVGLQCQNEEGDQTAWDARIPVKR